MGDSGGIAMEGGGGGTSIGGWEESTKTVGQDLLEQESTKPLSIKNCILNSNILSYEQENKTETVEGGIKRSW